MHDVLEGVLQYETKLVLIHMTQTCHYLTIKHLNHLITSVNLGYMEASSRLTEISLSDDKLKQNGEVHFFRHTLLKCYFLVQTTTQRLRCGYWVVFFPFWLANMFQKMTRTGAITFSFLDIVDIMFARRITEDTPGFLHHLIEEHHTNFTRLYPEYSVIPKMHFMVHVPRIMLRYVVEMKYCTLITLPAS